MKLFLYLMFTTYANLIFIHVLISWIPNARTSRFAYIVASIVEPYLAVIRQYLPRFGMLDFSAIVGYLLIELALVGVQSIL